MSTTKVKTIPNDVTIRRGSRGRKVYDLILRARRLRQKTKSHPLSDTRLQAAKAAGRL